jgi:uncharacterized protein
VPEPVADVYTPVPNDLQRLGGLLASRIHANIEGYLEHAPIKDLAQSFTRGETAAKDDLTAGKSAGLLLEAAANSYDYSADPQLKTVMDNLAKILMSHQEPTGYIGTYPGTQRWNHEDISSQSAILRALVAYSRVTGNEESLTVSRRLANPLVDRLSKGKGAVADAREALGPLLELYRATSDGRYLKFCRRLAQSSVSELNVENDLYSFLSLLSGLTDLYQLTGDEAYIKAAESGWKRVRDEQLSVTGAPLSQDDSNTGCLTQAWFRLNLDLLRTRGDARYAEQSQRTAFNQLLASQDPDTGRIDPCAPASGLKKPTLKIDNGAAAVSLGISTIPEMVWGRYSAGIAVLSYQPGHATLRLRRRATAQLYIEGNYPTSGNIVLHVEPSHDINFPLQLFVPSWAQSFAAEAGSTKLSGKPGQFLTLEREWKKGDTVKITIGMAVTTLKDSSHPGEIAIQRGPSVLAFTRGNSPAADLSSAAISPGTLTLKSEGENEDSFALQGRFEGKEAGLTLVPFAGAKQPYRIWIKAQDSSASQ